MRPRVQEARVATLATITSDGRPHLVPMTFVLDVETLYSVVDDKPKTTKHLQRLTNVRTDPRVTVLIDRYADDWSKLWWVRLEGTGRILEQGSELDRAIDGLATKYSPYRDHRPSGPVLAVEIERWAGWASQLGA